MISTKTLKAMKTPRKTYAIRVNTMIQMPGKKDSWRYPIHSFCAVARKVEDTLVLHLFDRTTRNEIVESYRYCICGSEVKLYSLEKRTFSKTFLSSRLSYGYCGFVINAATIADDMAIRENLKDMIEIDDEMSVNDIIRTFDEKLQKDRTRKKLDEKRRAVVELMERIPSIPDSFNETIEEAIEPSSYGFFNKGKEEVICSRCGSTFKYADVPKFKERDKGSCPVCGKSICYISEKRQEHKVETRMAALVQAIGNKRLVVRYFWITNNFRESPVPKRKVEEVTRTVIDFDKGTIEDYEMYWIPGHVDIIDWTPCKGSFYCVDGIHHKFFEGVMHTKELHEELAKAGLDGICGDYEAVNKLEVEYDSVLNQTLYFERIATRPYIEKLLKCKLYSLAKHYFKGEYDIKGELLNLQATSLTGLLKISKNRLKQMVEANGDYLMLHYVQEADKNPLYQSVSVEEIKKIGSTFEHQLANAFRLSVPTIRKTYRYVSENNIHASDYFDYLENAEFLHYNLNADSVRYPKKFKEEHDFAAKEVKSKLDEKAYYRIQLLLPAMHERYDFEDDDFIVTAPKDGKAIKDEGTKLGHCVSTYIPRVAKGETVILFIRRKSEPNKPFVTMEVKNDTVIQVRARENGTPEKAVQEFVKKFKKAKQVA